MSVTTPRIELLSRFLDVAELRHGVIANNVANVNTPGYKQMEVNFEEKLQRALTRGDANQWLKEKPQIVESAGAYLVREDENTVDIDQEMAQLAKNNLLYRTFAQLLAMDLNMHRTAITGQ